MSSNVNHRGSCFLNVRHVVCFGLGLLLGYKWRMESERFRTSLRT